MAMLTNPDQKKPEERSNPGQDEFDKLIERNFSPGDERTMEERAKDGAIDDNIKTGKGSSARAGEDESSSTPESSDSDEEEQLAEHEDQLGAGYRKNTKLSLRERFSNYQQRRLLIGGTLAALSSVVVIVLMLVVANFYKLDDIMSNIDAKTFARFNGVADRRSLAWMEAYMAMRMGDIGNNPDLDKGKNSDNIYFRSERVRNNPATDWYRTLRTSSFEKDVFEKHGFKFVSTFTNEGGKVRIRPGKITLNGEGVFKVDPDSISQADFAKLQSGDTATIRKFADKQTLDLHVFDNDKQARKELRKMVKDDTRFFQVLKRRQLRNTIKSMTGIRDWRFFEKTQNAWDEKKLDIRNKLIDRAIPDDTKSGKFIKCLFGISKCKFSDDPSNPSNQSGESLSGSGDTKKGEASEIDPDTGEVKKASIDYDPAADVVKDIVNQVTAVFKGLNFIALMDSLSIIHDSLEKGELSKGVEIAKGIQAMGLYTTLEIARDQMRSGEVNSAEVNKLMQVIGGFASSEAWSKVVEDHGDPSVLDGDPGNPKATAQAKKYCSQKAQSALEKDPNLVNTDRDYSFAYECPDKQIGGKNTAARLERAYKQTIGVVFGPLITAYSGVRNVPIIGGIITWANKAIAKVTEAALQAAISGLGLGNTVESIGKWIALHVASFLGAGPILHGKDQPDPDGVVANWAIQGSAFTAEANTRALGGALTTPASRVTTENVLAQYQNDELENMSAFDRYLSLSNPDSPTAHVAFAVNRMNFSSTVSKLSNFGSIFKTIGSALFIPFNHHLFAQAADSGYRGVKMAGIESYDIPPACFKLNVLTATPLTGTNALSVFRKHHIRVKSKDLDKLKTWNIENNSRDFWQVINDIITDHGHDDRDDVDDIAEVIYNCNLFDTGLRGGIGYTHGYTNDGGLNDSGNASVATTEDSGSAPTGDAQELAKQILKNRKIELSGRLVKEDIEAASKGEPGSAGVPTSSAILQLIAALGKDHYVTISAIQSGGTGHCYKNGAPTPKAGCPEDAHYTGDGVDFSALDGEALKGRDTWSIKIMRTAFDILPEGSAFGQDPAANSSCGTKLALPAGFTEFADSCNHLHVQVPKDTP